jgi:ferredoxin
MMLPPRPLMWSVIGLLTVVALARPLTMAPKFDPFTRAADIPTDLFVAFWLPLTASLGGGQLLTLLSLATMALLLVPALAVRRGVAAPPPSAVDEELCTGCTQCSIDCPYGAIEMIARKDDRPTLVAHVAPDLCVSCGICAGSCAPMGVGPPGRTGRDQLTDLQVWLADPARQPGEVVLVGCAQGAGRFEPLLSAAGAVVRTVSCAGNLHTSVIERLIRSGAGGVLVAACPPRDCWNREGPRWLHERVYNDREAELQPRVPRERVRIVHAGAHESALLLAEWRRFVADVAALGGPPLAADTPETEPVCDPPETEDEEAQVVR